MAAAAKSRGHRSTTSRSTPVKRARRWPAHEARPPARQPGPKRRSPVAAILGPPARALKKALRPVARFAARSKPIRDWLVRFYDRTSSDGSGRTRRHPVDLAYGIDTGGLIPGYALLGASREPDKTIYLGSQPSVVRRALAFVAQPAATVFLDLGCGKGRVLAVASEFAFREVVGVEFSTELAALAEANMAVVRRDFPGRPPIRVVTGDALAHPLPDAPAVIFLYNPFGEVRIRRLRERIEEALRNAGHPLTVVYYNPVWGAVFDASPELVRAHAESFAYDANEIGAGTDRSDVVVIWQDRRHAPAQPSLQAQRRIVVTKADWRVELDDGDPNRIE